MSRKFMVGKRKGFTMVELIFVVIFLGILAAIAIPKISGSTETAVLASMKNDARAAITAEDAYYIQSNEYADATVEGGTEGAIAALGTSNIKVGASPNNTVTVTSKDCGDGTKGYTLNVTSTKTNKTINYDSCNDASIKVNNDGGPGVNP